MTLRYQQGGRRNSESGYAMAGLLVAIGVMSIAMSVALPSWRTFVQREKEAELIFRGEQYMRAIELYQRQFPGAYPTDMDALIEQRFLRRAYQDPMTGEAFEYLTQASVRAVAAPAVEIPGMPGVSVQQQVGDVARVDDGESGTTRRPEREAMTEAARGLGEGGGGIIGVATTATGNSIRTYRGRTTYDQWLFVYVPQSTQPGQPAGPGALPGAPGVNPGLIGEFGTVLDPNGGQGGGRGGRDTNTPPR
jgi:type II secretory pathway pseudopilin PulG